MDCVFHSVSVNILVYGKEKMKLPNCMLLLFAVLIVSVPPAMAQVEKAAMKTTGISCGMCAAVSEVLLRYNLTCNF